MQQCLNEELSFYFTNYPISLTIFVLGSTAILTVSLLCNQSFPCSTELVSILLSIGVSFCLMIGIFIILPAILLLIMNLFWKKPKKIIKNSPLTVIRVM